METEDGSEPEIRYKINTGTVMIYLRVKGDKVEETNYPGRFMKGWSIHNVQKLCSKKEWSLDES